MDANAQKERQKIKKKKDGERKVKCKNKENFLLSTNSTYQKNYIIIDFCKLSFKKWMQMNKKKGKNKKKKRWGEKGKM